MTYHVVGRHVADDGVRSSQVVSPPNNPPILFPHASFAHQNTRNSTLNHQGNLHGPLLQGSDTARPHYTSIYLYLAQIQLYYLDEGTGHLVDSARDNGTLRRWMAGT